MKKLINSVDRVVEEALDGLVVAFPHYLSRIPNSHVLARAVPKASGKVGIVSGGGSGHEPAHGGYVGFGMLDAAVAGEVFTSPTPDQVLTGIKAADHGAGVLLVVKNYTGDVMNFDIAREMAEAEGIATAAVTVNDDVAVEDSLYTSGRRGIAGTVFVHKIAGALAEQGASLDQVVAAANGVIANLASMGFAFESCTVPAAGKATFELASDEMEMGIGIHGEPGTHRMKVEGASELTSYLLGKIVADLEITPDDRVVAMVNGMGATPLLELAVMANEVAHQATGAGFILEQVFLGEFMTSLEMAGASLTLLRVDETRLELLRSACDTPALRQGVRIG